jgi:hypothetical protein
VLEDRLGKLMRLPLGAHGGRFVQNVAQAEHRLAAGLAQRGKRVLEFAARAERMFVHEQHVGAK